MPCSAGRAGHISAAVKDTGERGPLEPTMQIYENNMQISRVLAIENKQTNDRKESDYYVSW